MCKAGTSTKLDNGQGLEKQAVQTGHSADASKNEEFIH